VLAYLAAQPGEVVSTEKLLAALWPESDADRAASAFGAALSRLRALLLDQVPGLTGPLVYRDRVGRTCRLDDQVFTSDVHRFVGLCREARRLPPAEASVAYEQARALYTGDLLEDRPYPWLHERDDDGLTLPERYRETMRQVTNELAGLYAQLGEWARAVSLYRELLKVEPTLEDVVRRLYRCYGELGDRVSLVREHRRLQQALREEYGSDGDPDDDPEMATPEPETVAVYRQVLAHLDAQGGGASGRGGTPADDRPPRGRPGRPADDASGPSRPDATGPAPDGAGGGPPRAPGGPAAEDDRGGTEEGCAA
jgi:DNA-binding SARP family transcriptional activator